MTLELTADAPVEAPQTEVKVPRMSVKPRVSAARPLEELVSPFVTPAAEGPALEDLLEQQSPSLIKDLLTSPSAMATRMLDADQAPKAMANTLLLLLVTTGMTGAFFASLVGTELLRAAVLLPVAVSLAVAAAMGPVAATSLMAGARLPWQLLATALTVSVAAGTVTMAGLVPVAIVARHFDPDWAGPLAIVGSFGVAGLMSGRRIHAVLKALATEVCTRTGVALSTEGHARINLVGRVAFVQLAFTLTLAVWSLQILR